MTDTTEKLLPCDHCACVAILRKTENRWGDTCYVVECSNEEDCGIATMMFRNKQEAIAAWNRRAAEKPKWSKETPTIPGRYFVKHDVFGYIDVNVWDVNGRLKVNSFDHSKPLWLDELKTKVLWFFIPEAPVLPEEVEET